MFCLHFVNLGGTNEDSSPTISERTKCSETSVCEGLLHHTWGFKSYDHNWKSVEDITFKLVDIVSKGGNYLLNVGPTGEGVIPEESVVTRAPDKVDSVLVLEY